MEIIKDAFIEGRESDVMWPDSKSKQNSIKVDVLLENFSSMHSREKLSLIPLEQICPTTNTVVNKFPSRLAACRYICKDILKNPNKNPISVGGNLEICMRAGWKAYGFYWKIASKTEDVIDDVKEDASVGGCFVKTRIYYRNSIKETVFDSMKDTMAHFGLSKGKLRRVVNNEGSDRTFLKGAILQYYQPTPSTVIVGSVAEICEKLNCSYNIISNGLIRNKIIINNTTYVLKKKVKSKLNNSASNYITVGYNLYDNNVHLGSFKTIKDMAEHVNISRQHANKRLLKGLSLDFAGRYTAKPRLVIK